MASEQDKAFEEAELKRESERQRRRDEIQFLLKSELGRAFLARVIYEHCALEVASFSANANEAAFNEGTRAVGNVLNREAFLADRNGWALMRNEHTERRRAVEPEALNRTVE